MNMSFLRPTSSRRPRSPVNAIRFLPVSRLRASPTVFPLSERITSVTTAAAEICVRISRAAWLARGGTVALLLPTVTAPIGSPPDIVAKEPALVGVAIALAPDPYVVHGGTAEVTAGLVSMRVCSPFHSLGRGAQAP